MSDDSTLPEGFDEAEITVTAVDDEGDVVSETVTAVLDEETGLTAVDDVIVVEGADGTVVMDERVSLIDQEGNSALLSETVAAMDADGDIVIETTESD